MVWRDMSFDPQRNACCRNWIWYIICMMNSHHQHQLSRRLAQEVVGSDFLIISWIHFYSKIFKIFKIYWVTENRFFLILTTCIKAWKFDDYLHFMLKVGSVDECSSLIVVFETLRSSWSCDCHWSDHHVHWLRRVSVWITNLDREGQDESQTFFCHFKFDSPSSLELIWTSQFVFEGGKATYIEQQDSCLNKNFDNVRNLVYTMYYSDNLVSYCILNNKSRKPEGTLNKNATYIGRRISAASENLSSHGRFLVWRWIEQNRQLLEEQHSSEGLVWQVNLFL